MLDTVLEIGRILRLSPDGLRHHRYVKSAPVPDEKNPVVFWRVPVQEDGSFDFGQRETLEDENKQRQLFYLNYKTSDADATKSYLFGDVYRTVTKLGEDGNFRFGDPEKGSWMNLNSFQRGEKIQALATPLFAKFRHSFRTQMGDIETFINENKSVYLHFDFSGRGWHHLDELAQLNESVVRSFFDKGEQGYTMQAFLFKTLTSSEARLPHFLPEGAYRSRIFSSADAAMDLLYGVNYASKAVWRRGDVKIIVLPKGRTLSAQQIERFFEKAVVGSEEAEAEITENEKGNAAALDEDDLFSFLPDADAVDFVEFDFIFSKSGGTKADTDMIEIAGLEHSKLTYIRRRVSETRKEVEAARSALFPKLTKPLLPLRTAQSFLNLLGDMTTAKKKYQSHLLKVLPQIYTETYFHDPVLLPALIEKTEFNTRNGSPNFNLLKFDFFFLTKLQSNGTQNLMDIQSSPSHHVGFLLGKLARQFSGPSTPIKSFEKNYVGLLSRRIGSLNDVMQFANDVNQKLVMHERAKYTFRTSDDLAQALKNFTGRYDRNECAFGFFESYFAPLPPKKEGDKEDSENTGADTDTDQNTDAD